MLSVIVNVGILLFDLSLQTCDVLVLDTVELFVLVFNHLKILVLSAFAVCESFPVLAEHFHSFIVE